MSAVLAVFQDTFVALFHRASRTRVAMVPIRCYSGAEGGPERGEAAAAQQGMAHKSEVQALRSA